MVNRLTMLLFSLALVPGMSLAADDGWRTERFNIVVRDQGVRDVLRQFGALIGVPVVLSDAVEAQVSARFEGASGEQIIDAIAREYGFDWRYDGRRIEVSSSSEQVSRILDMGGVLRKDLIVALESLDSYEPRFPISAVDGELGLLVGPPRYVAIVEIVLAELVEKRIAEQALEAERVAAEQARQLAEQRRLEALLAEQRKRKPREIVSDVPIVNRGGRWGG